MAYAFDTVGYAKRCVTQVSGRTMLMRMRSGQGFHHGGIGNEAGLAIRVQDTEHHVKNEIAGVVSGCQFVANRHE